MSPTELVSAGVSAHVELSKALDHARDSATTRLKELDQLWQPVAVRLMGWHDAADVLYAESELLSLLKKAEAWLKQSTASLRDDRMAPIGDEAQRIWESMRQHSDVSLESVKLAGASTRRRVSLRAVIGSTETAAFSVMSQGELHTLGLSLFLPRATMDASPFRFVVIDDPVQAMDPGKVSGLADVLARIATTRQVIVFSHDDRLAEAVRRLPDPPTMWEVQRRRQSAVHVVRSMDPIDRYLDDARALANTSEMPRDIRGELVANCCRGALEAAAHRKYRTAHLRRGESLADVESVLSAAPTTHAVLSLAVFDATGHEGELYRRLSADLDHRAVGALKACKVGAHVGLDEDLRPFIRNIERLTHWVAR
ncbi:MAG: hypothetical protein GEV28_02990 [Actinophytocola sp.]|nr:hypothetical protein [Actinophytocola sp.]